MINCRKILLKRSFHLEKNLHKSFLQHFSSAPSSCIFSSFSPEIVELFLKINILQKLLKELTRQDFLKIVY